MSTDRQLTVQGRLGRLTGIQIVGTGSYVPEAVVTNADLASLGFDDQWIIQRTGIRQRRHAPEEMATSDMAIEAARRAIDVAGVDPGQIDLVLLATLSPDHLMPATACRVQDALGLCAPAVDLSAACAGFMYALITASQFVGTGCSRLALVVGADCNSRVVDPTDRKTYPLFGDGAGAVLLGPGKSDQGLLAYTLGADGSGQELLYRPRGGSRIPFEGQNHADAKHFMQMEGRPIFRWAVRMIEETSREVIAAAGLEVDDIDLWLLHQANRRILDAAAENLGVDAHKLAVHVDRYGNTSAGSVPIAVDEARRAGQIQAGSRIVLSGFGAGLSWGTAVFGW